MSEITAEVVAEFLTGADNEYVEDTGAKAGVHSEGPVIHITVTPQRADRTVDRENAKHFRAVVVPGETVPDLAELDRLKARLEAAEAIMRQCLAAVEHAEVAHLLGLYFDAAARADQAEQDGGAL